MKTFNLLVRLIPAIIMLQTLFFKFSGAAESVYIFNSIGLEPWGRIGTGVLELIASIFLLIDRRAIWGAFLGIGLMFGAVVTHLFMIGVEVMGDGGQLFFMALATLICCAWILYQRRAEFSVILYSII
ncbi:DoxX family membrane protein [Flectobacillus roseus]|uniref:DoxX family membrane protein n=1 Tax=Flectobacillus roseus TaxID=502259 RepID=UPI0024B7C124|nr:DoxX family membrane protein [Flectobacillus roseus]MDI9870824.1 DoxX family protein [Flectobacillus roseus]